ncbi:MAG: hypothetical protein MJ180_03960, partial [Candidatus Gastranaerophilales bacterium]|nr:hypothetical protein [Candidatus Gastranaerophilales bacterium]
MDKAKLPPQSIESEENVLGALMVKSTVIANVAEILQPDMFYDPANAEIYACILELFNSSRPVDIITVSEALNSKNKLQLV